MARNTVETVQEVTHSKNFEKVKGYYNAGLWSIERVRAAVGKWITAEEYKEITGEDYE